MEFFEYALLSINNLGSKFMQNLFHECGLKSFWKIYPRQTEKKTPPPPQKKKIFIIVQLFLNWKILLWLLTTYPSLWNFEPFHKNNMW